uniref:G_PROTEIN_RECEP_F1_2 domain-containing protein n=1 Tax=Heterorhabditis bacteriophora TaxID=37862 RepID=A0A1I7XF94_HETBA
MHPLDPPLPNCTMPARSLAMLFDGPLSAVVILAGILGNVYCLRVLFRISINTSMLVSLTGLAIWDIVLLLAAFSHHSLWTSLDFLGIREEPWDPYLVALNGLMECAHITSRHETTLMQNPYYHVFYRTIFLSVLKTFGPFVIITMLTVSTVRSMRQSMDCRATILIEQGKDHLFMADQDKTRSLQTISVLLLGKFLMLRCWPTTLAMFPVFFGSSASERISPLPIDASEFFLLLNSATNSFVFVVLKSAFETRRLKRIRMRQRELVAQHAEQVLSIGKALAADKLFLLQDIEHETAPANYADR